MPKTLARVILGRFRLAVYATSRGRVYLLCIGAYQHAIRMEGLPIA